ncbi:MULTISPECIES: ammonium transporter [Pseudonocardia]|nr:MULTISPECIES: ammonium transporter [Pseudonocardia]
MRRVLVVVAIAVLASVLGGGVASAAEDGSLEATLFQFHRGQDIFLMLMLVAFLMLFIRRYEWGVCLATLLVLSVSWPLYLIGHTLLGNPLDIEAVILGVFASITLVIAIGVFLGHISTSLFLVAAVLFVPGYMLNEWFMFSYLDGVLDAGGSILVHMFAAYWGWGVILALRNSAILREPMRTTTHSVSFVWLASLLLFVLWPSFVTALLPPDQIIPAMINCYLALMASALCAYLLMYVLRRRIDPLAYTYALLAGGVAIGATVDLATPWQAWLIGAAGGIVSTLSFLYLNDWLTRRTGQLDTMGVHNLHGVPGLLGALAAFLVADAPAGQWAAIAGAIVIGMVTGAVTGLVLRLFPRPGLMLDDAEALTVEESRETEARS